MINVHIKNNVHMICFKKFIFDMNFLIAFKMFIYDMNISMFMSK